MSYQLQFIEENLKNSNVIIAEDTLTAKCSQSICYVYDLGEYRMDFLAVENKIFQHPYEEPKELVRIEHDGIIKSIENLDKLTIYYDCARDFENVYDYNHPDKRILRVLIKNKLTAYHYKHKLLLSTNGKNAKNIINCIKNDIYRGWLENNIKDAKEKKKTILMNYSINIEKFMKYLVENYSANVKAIYAGNLPQRENKAIAIYGDEANKSHFYEYIKHLGNKLSCINVKMDLKSSTTPKTILFTENRGIMVAGNMSEELSLKLIIEANEIIEDFLNNETYI